MQVDRGSFLMLVTTLAAGGSVGYVAAEKRVFPAVDGWVGRVPEPGTEAPITTATATATPAVATSAVITTAPPAPVAPAAPACDDGVATAAMPDCPGPGLPTVEGGCGSLASLRCAELKQSLKPRVAAAAVTCIAKLNGQERCDPARIQLCGHLALMNACPDAPPAGTPLTTDAGAPVPAASLTPLAATCQGIIDACGASPVAPSMTECRQLLSGMTEQGREKTKTCMRTHCFDRGLVGCEGIEGKR